MTWRNWKNLTKYWTVYCMFGPRRNINPSVLLSAKACKKTGVIMLLQLQGWGSAVALSFFFFFWRNRHTMKDRCCWASWKFKYFSTSCWFKTSQKGAKEISWQCNAHRKKIRFHWVQHAAFILLLSNFISHYLISLAFVFTRHDCTCG